MAQDTQGIDRASAPVGFIPEDEGRQVEDGVALCLSGGGYRAMVFHVGALWRLNELGMLRRIDRFSSVSGGSITAATLGLHWDELGFDDKGVAANFKEALVIPIRRLASVTVDVGAILGGLLWGGIAARVQAAYRKHLFGKKTLQDLPDEPRFVINATNVQSKVLWRFSKPYMADWRVGRVMKPRVPLAVAVCVVGLSAVPVAGEARPPPREVRARDRRRPPVASLHHPGGPHRRRRLRQPRPRDGLEAVPDGARE